MNRRYIDFVPHQGAPKSRSEKPAAEDDFDTTETYAYEEVEVETQPIVKIRRFDDFVSVPVRKKAKKPVVKEPEPEPEEDLKKELEEEFANEPVEEPTSEVNDAPLDNKLTIEEIMRAREAEQRKAQELDEPASASYGLGMIEDYTPIDARKPAFINAAAVEKRPLSKGRDEEKRPSVDLEDELKVAKSEDLTKRKIETEKIPEVPMTKPDNEFKKPKFINTHLVEKRPLSKTDYRNRTPINAAEETTTSPVTIIDKPEKDSRLGFIITIILTILLGAAVGTVAFLLIPH